MSQVSLSKKPNPGHCSDIDPDLPLEVQVGMLQIDMESSITTITFQMCVDPRGV